MKLFGILLNLVLVSGSLEIVTDQNKHDQISRDSYNRVASFVVAYFSEHCKLGLQNCIFQTQWDHLFSKDRLFYSNPTTQPTSRKKRTDTNNLLNANETYHFCKAYVVAKFCMDDYLVKSEDYAECFNETFGNRPNDFKRSIERYECKPHFEYYLNSMSYKTINKFYFLILFILNNLLSPN